MRRVHRVLASSAALLTVILAGSASSRTEPTVPQSIPGPFPVSIRVDASRSLGPLPRAWRFFGADEPNYAYLPDGRKLIGELGTLAPGHVYFRAHNLLTTGDGTPALKWGSTNAYREDEHGRPLYDWTILDRIFDTYLQRGVRPYVQIGFMPKALSTHPEPYQHTWTPTAKYNEIFLGWTHPPTDFTKWGDIAHEWAAHAVSRYGRAEVEKWYWEVWNEPNIGYWSGTPEQFHKLHDFAIDGVRRALPTARVGGPDVAGDGGQFSRSFFEHVLHGTNYATGGTGTPTDFVSFHAKGKPTFVEDHVRMGIAAQLATVDAGFGIVSSFPELQHTPIVIGESDPDGCAACQGPQLGYRNTTMYSSYTAASYARILDLASRHDVNLEGNLTWAFEFEGQPLFAGFRALATGGIDLPVLNVFRMLSRMASGRIEAVSDASASLDAMMRDGVHDRPDVAALASRDDRRVTILLWHYHDDDVPGAPADVSLMLQGLPASSNILHVRRYVVDAEHGNAFTAWRQMGSPASPGADQRASLEAASQLADVESRDIVASGPVSLRVTLARQAVSLLVIEW
jgi:xylan 1,4-beta-xylosidase